MERVDNGRLGMEESLVWVGRGRGRCGDVKVKEIKRRRIVHERAEDEGNSERAVCRWW